MSSAQPARKHIIHDEDHDRNSGRLERFYRQVARHQDQAIADACGVSVVDVGAGYGTLSELLRERGKRTVALDIDPEKARRAKQLSGVNIVVQDFLTWQEGPGERYDTVVFRESLNHLPLRDAFERARGLGAEVDGFRCIVFQGTENLVLRLMKRLMGHREFEQKTPLQIIAGLEAAGLQIEQITYRDTVAFPLSGGWWSPELVPPWDWARVLVWKADDLLTRLARWCGAEKQLCFRVLVVGRLNAARKP